MAPPPEPKKDDGNEEKDETLDSLIEEGGDGPKLAKAKSEKKRDREQHRRNAFNEGLDRLTDLIFLIDPQLRIMAESRVTKISNKTPNTYQLLSRVELINSAVSTLARVHQENERTKLAIAQIMSRGMPPSGLDGQNGGAIDTVGAPEALLGLGSPPPRPAKGGGAASLVRPPAQQPPFASMTGPAFSGSSNLFSPNPMMGYPLMAQVAGLQSSGSNQGSGANAGQASESTDVKGTETTSKDDTNMVGSSGRDISKERAPPSPKKVESETKEDDKPSPRKRRRNK